MTIKQLAERIDVLERELALLKAKLEKQGLDKPWWERIAGTFEGDPIYKKAMKLGSDYRRAPHPEKLKRKNTR